MAALISPVSNVDAELPTHHREAEEQEQNVSASPDRNPLLFLGFNQDSGRFACGTALGFRVYDCQPFMEASCREADTQENAGIAYIEPLFRSSIFALVGGGESPRYPPNKVIIWDDDQACCIGELSFRSQIRSVKLRRDRIVVALEFNVYVYNFADLKLLLQIDTVANPKGLCAISSTSNSLVLACPSFNKGQVRLDFHGSKKPKFFSAHDSFLACLVLTLDGRLLATASSKGTLIRIFNTQDGTRVQEVRRGVDKANIFSISFSSSAQWLAVSSDRGTIHVFSLRGDTEEGESVSLKRQDSSAGSGNSSSNKSLATPTMTLNRGSSLSFMKGVLPRYFSSEWSFSQFRLPEEIKSIVAFGPEEHTVVIVGSDGSFYRCTIDQVQGGEMTKQEHVRFLTQST